MTLTRLLRTTAAALAVIALGDPACTVERNARLPVLVRPAWSNPADVRLAQDVIARLTESAGDDLDLNSSLVPAAVVLAGHSREIENVPPHPAVSLITRTAATNLSVRDIIVSPRLRVGLSAQIVARIHSEGAVGANSVIALEQDGIALDTVEHRWTRSPEIFEARFTYLPMASGIQKVRVSVSPSEGEVIAEDNSADVFVRTEQRAAKVLVYEARPSWMSAFVRRALERSALFELASLSRSSRGVVVRGGGPPSKLTARSLEGYDAILVGAPEELRHDEIDVLGEFARVRGGAVFWLPDRPPTGAFKKLLQTDAFARTDEVLLQAPVTLRGTAETLRAAEFSVPTGAKPGVRSVAALAQGASERPVVMSWPDGAGRLLFSGALDSWRHRDDAFADFWRAEIAAAAALSPDRLEVDVEPAGGVPGEELRVRVSLRPTEFSANLPRQFPLMSARLTPSRGDVAPVRLWPSTEPGVFEGAFEASDPGDYVLDVSAGDRLTASTPVRIAADTRPMFLTPADSMARLAAASGGVVTAIDDLAPLQRKLAERPRPRIASTVHPTRSGWWGISFIGLICAEWLIRRRRGLA